MSKNIYGLGPNRVHTNSAMVLTLPEHSAPPETELLFGESFEVIGIQGSWATGRTVAGDEGFINVSTLTRQMPEPTHRIRAVVSIARANPGFKASPYQWLGMHSQVVIENTRNRFMLATGLGWIYEDDIEPIGGLATDWVRETEKFLHLPYVWGGRHGHNGLDCSGLVKNGLQTAGLLVPHSSGKIEELIRTQIPITPQLSGLRRGDLVFWKGHVGLMLDEGQLLHATAHRMSVVIEPLSEVVERRRQKGQGEITSVKRL